MLKRNGASSSQRNPQNEHHHNTKTKANRKENTTPPHSLGNRNVFSATKKFRKAHNHKQMEFYMHVESVVSRRKLPVQSQQQRPRCLACIFSFLGLKKITPAFCNIYFYYPLEKPFRGLMINHT